ncbi:unnamed protein product, partial [Urochloa humidicola]
QHLSPWREGIKGRERRTLASLANACFPAPPRPAPPRPPPDPAALVAAMAMRSLVGMLKALPRRMPGFGAFVPKGIPWSKSSSRLTDPTKYGSVQDTVLSKTYPDQHKILMQGEVDSQRQRMVYNSKTVLLGIVFGSVGYLAGSNP